MKLQKIKIALVFLAVSLLGSCSSSRNFPEVKKLSEYPKTEFLPTLENKLSKDKNAVYCVTLLYAWEQVRKTANTTFEVPTDLQDTQKELVLLNNSTSFKDVLDKDEYEVEGKIEGNEIKTKAEFEKSLPFEFKLESFDNELVFEGKKVASFGVFGQDKDKEEVIDILHFKSNDEFVIRLNSKDEQHEIILFKTQENFESFAKMNAKVQSTIEEGVEERSSGQATWKFYLSDEDEVVIPKFNFNIENNFVTIEGNKIVSKSGQNYIITQAFQQTAFIIDEKGAKIKSKAKVTTKSMAVEKPQAEQPKKMRFDKPFFILLKKVNSENPYFVLFVNNAELMVKE